MHVSTFHDDLRPRQRARVRHELTRLIADLQRDCPTHLVLTGLVAVARELHQRIEGADPVARPSRRGVAP